MTVFKRTLLTLSLAVFIFSATFIISMFVFMNSLYYEINTAGLENTTKTLMASIGNDHLKEIFTVNIAEADEFGRLREIELPTGIDGAYRLTLIAPSGYVLWDSHVTESLVNHIDREEIRAALEGREESARRNSISTGMKLLYFAIPVFDSENEVIGVFRLSYLLSGFWIRLSPVIYPFLIFACLIAIIAFFVMFAFSRSLSSSLGRLVNITQTGTSLLSTPETEPVAPEFKSLEKAIRAMTYELNFRLEQTRAESNRLEAILNGMSEAVFSVDPDLKLHMVNPKARELFGLGNRDIKGMSLLEATRSTELAGISKKALSAGAALETELVFHTGTASAAEGSRLVQHFQVYVSPLSPPAPPALPPTPNPAPKFLGAGGAGGVVLVLQEITQLVKLERVRKDFVANVSHELRTPIQVIKGFSETLLDTVSEFDNSDMKQIVHFIEIISKNAGVMENLTNDLLILAGLENNDRGFDIDSVHEKEELNITSLINEAVSSLELKAEKKKIEIIVNCTDDFKASLYGSFIIQALINLIDNAIKYSPSKSKIWVSALEEKGDLVLQVRDKGIGIPAEHQERIFERFYRVDRARSRGTANHKSANRFEGSGLGLSIVRHITLLHGGKTEVESRIDEGSIFRIRIPLNHPNS